MADPLGFEVKIVHANILTYPLDVFVLIYPQEWTSLGQSLVARLPPDSPIVKAPPAPDKWRIYPANGVVKAKSILVIGAPPTDALNYNVIRQVGRQIVVALAESADNPPAGQVGVTILGPGGALDEVESLRALLFGFIAAIEDGATPRGLQRISIFENHAQRAAILTEALDRFWQRDARTFAASLDLPDDLITEADQDASEDQTDHFGGQAAPPTSARSSLTMAREAPTTDKADRKPIVLSAKTHRPVVPIASLNEPSIFVAMPYAPRYNDVYYFAILPAVKANHYQCIRLDKTIYTGNVLETIKKRIAAAKLVIALIDSLNPNVFLEIGYAWGVKTPVLLLVSDEQRKDKLPFDVASDRYYVYESIRQLAQHLPKEIKGAIDGTETED